MNKQMLFNFFLPFFGAIPLLFLIFFEPNIKETIGVSTYNILFASTIILTIVLSIYPVVPLIKNLLCGKGYRLFWGNGKLGKEIALNGKEGIATIKGIGENSRGTTLTINDQPVLNLQLIVNDGTHNYEVSIDTIIPRSKVPQFQPGVKFPVRIHHHEKELIVFDHEKALMQQQPSYSAIQWTEEDKEIVKNQGIEARANLLNIEDTGKTTDFKPIVKLFWNIQIPGNAAYQIEREISADTAAIVVLKQSIGKSFNAKVHPKDKEKVQIDVRTY
jgi:hypothetical protein